MRAFLKIKELTRLKEMFEFIDLLEVVQYKSIAKDRPFMFDAKTKIIMA